MNEEHIENTLSELSRSSKSSLIMVIFGALCVLGSLYYSATRLTPLETEISELKNTIDKLDAQAQEKQNKLNELGDKLESTNKQLSISLASLNLLQEGTRYLINKQYLESIESLSAFSGSVQETPEVLNLLGYAELRYTQYWRENSVRTEITEDQRQTYSDNTKKYFNLAEDHLTKAAQSKKSYSWPMYNLALLYFQDGKKKKALFELSQMLAHAPNMIKWLCEDGQFRKMRIDKDTAANFTDIVERVAKSEGVASCWVTKPVKSNSIATKH